MSQSNFLKTQKTNQNSNLTNYPLKCDADEKYPLKKMKKKKKNSVKKKSSNKSDKEDGLAEEVAKSKLLVSSVLEKPKATEKLLTRPPFRFLFDIVLGLINKFRVICRTSEFYDSILDESQLISENVKSKEEKILYLKAIVSFVEQTLSTKLQLRLSKLVAGLECKNTNIFIQKLVLCYQKCKEQVLEKKQPQSQPAIKEEKIEISEDEEKLDETHAPVKTNESDSETKEEAEVKQNSAVSIESKKEDNEGSVYQRTKDILSGLISKPKMTEKYLNRPPFRFIFDIVIELNKLTGFVTDNELLKKEQLISENVRDKNGKLSFLQPLVNFVEENSSHQQGFVNPKKIIAGLDCEKTNLFLQEMGLYCKILLRKRKNSQEPAKEIKKRAETLSTNNAQNKHTKTGKTIEKMKRESSRSLVSRGSSRKSLEPKKATNLEQKKKMPLNKQIKNSDANVVEKEEKQTPQSTNARPQTARKRPANKKITAVTKTTEAATRVPQEIPASVEQKIPENNKETDAFYDSVVEEEVSEDEIVEEIVESKDDQQNKTEEDKFKTGYHNKENKALEANLKKVASSMGPLIAYIESYESNMKNMKKEIENYKSLIKKEEAQIKAIQEEQKKSLYLPQQQIKQLDEDIEAQLRLKTRLEKKTKQNENRYNDIIQNMCFPD